MIKKSPHKVFHRLANAIIMNNVLNADDCLTPSIPNPHLRKKYPRVGQLIESLSPDDREALVHLTSKDAANIRLF